MLQQQMNTPHANRSPQQRHESFVARSEDYNLL